MHKGAFEVEHHNPSNSTYLIWNTMKLNSYFSSSRLKGLFYCYIIKGQFYRLDKRACDDQIILFFSLVYQMYKNGSL